jgi:hypothetical protein
MPQTNITIKTEQTTKLTGFMVVVNMIRTYWCPQRLLTYFTKSGLSFEFFIKRNLISSLQVAKSMTFIVLLNTATLRTISSFSRWGIYRTARYRKIMPIFAVGLFHIILSGCAHSSPAKIVEVYPQVDRALLQCSPEPRIGTPSNQEEFAEWAEKVRLAGDSCRSKVRLLDEWISTWSTTNG